MPRVSNVEILFYIYEEHRVTNLYTIGLQYEKLELSLVLCSFRKLNDYLNKFENNIRE